MLTDIQIAQSIKLKPILEVAYDLGIKDSELDLYGKYKAKLNDSIFKRLSSKKDGKLILVTAINPTPAGEGKTTTTVGIGQAMGKIGKSAVIALREPSLGPVFGIKGGAAGGGYAQVLPMEDINLHFTGDMHAITAANNLICAVIDNHIHQGNSLNIDVRKILIKRCMDMNDRALRKTIVGLGGKINGFPREDSFIITVASEIMAILCLSKDIHDLKTRIGNILIAFTNTGSPVYSKELNVHGAAAVLLKDSINPNLVQTTEGTPVIMHGGPFANIAHGCNSVRATKIALKLADYCITEAGFGADLGAEKFFDIKCRLSGLRPSAVVIVATVRALKYNGGCPLNEITDENINALKSGIVNLKAHINNMKKFNIPVLIAINKFHTDTENEIEVIKEICIQNKVDFALSDVFQNGGNGAIELAKKICLTVDNESEFHTLYQDNLSIKDKILEVASKIYGALNVSYSKDAEMAIQTINSLGKSHIPICIAKTQYSLSDNPKKLGAPSGFTLNVRDMSLSNGAGFIVVYTGDIMTMPGLPKIPAAENIDIDSSGTIKGLF